METSKNIPAQRVAFSLSEFQSMMGISRSTVYRMMADGQLRTVKCRGRRLVPLLEMVRLAGADLDDWAA